MIEEGREEGKEERIFVVYYGTLQEVFSWQMFGLRG